MAFILRSSPFSDFIRTMHFHLMDVSMQVPVVLTPAFGFKSCTAPEIIVQTKEIKEGNFEYKRHVLQSAEVNEITLTQGVRFGNSDFYDWIKDAVTSPSFNNYRRNLLLVQFAQVDTAEAGNSIAGAIDALTSVANAGANLIFDTGSIGGSSKRIPARAWMLRECIPTRYKSGSDHDAMNAEVSLAELSIKYTYFTEFNTGI